MIRQDHRHFALRNAYCDETADRVKRFLPMVHRLAWHVHGSGRPGIEVEDLVQSGLVALTEAAQQHDRDSEDGFAAYAKLRVRGAMFDLVRRNMHQTRGAAERRRALRGADERLREGLGRPPSEAEVAASLAITVGELARRRLECEPLRFESIDETYSESDLAFACPREDGFAALSNRDVRARLAAAIAALPPRLQIVTQLYFVEEMNLAEIAQVIEVSVPRVHQIKAQALAALRDAMGG
jgi:RNA polymerase sigma factor FliA